MYCDQRSKVIGALILASALIASCSSNGDNGATSDHDELTRSSLESGLEEEVCSDEFIQSVFDTPETEILESGDISTSTSNNVDCEIEIGTFFNGDSDPAAVHKTSFWVVDLLNENSSHTLGETEEALSHGATVCETVTEFPLPGFETDLYEGTDYIQSEVEDTEVCNAKYKSVHNLASSRDRPVQSVVTFLHEGYLVQTSVVTENKMNNRGNRIAVWDGGLGWEIPSHQTAATTAFEGIFDFFQGRDIGNGSYQLGDSPDEINVLCDESVEVLTNDFFDTSASVEGFERFSLFSPNYNCGVFGLGNSIDKYDEDFTRNGQDGHFQAFAVVDWYPVGGESGDSCDAPFLDVFGMSESISVESELNGIDELCVRHMTKEREVSGLISATWVSDDYQGEVLVGAYGLTEELVEEEFAQHLANDSAVAEIAASILESDEEELKAFLGV